MKKPARLPVLAIRLEPGIGFPLQQQLYERLREAIVLGRLRRGVRLPASRVLAQGLGISRNTVLFAYEELAAEGLVSGRTGSGTCVACTPSTIRLNDPDGLTFDGYWLSQLDQQVLRRRVSRR